MSKAGTKGKPRPCAYCGATHPKSLSQRTAKTHKERVEEIRSMPTETIAGMLDHLAGDETQPLQLVFRHLATRLRSLEADLARARREALGTETFEALADAVREAIHTAFDRSDRAASKGSAAYPPEFMRAVLVADAATAIDATLRALAGTPDATEEETT